MKRNREKLASRRKLANQRLGQPVMEYDEYSTEGEKAVTRDLSQRIRAEEKLRQAEERYHSLFDRMLDGVYLSTHEGRFVDVNPALVKMFGYSSKQEMMGVDIKKELYFSPEERGSHILDTGKEEVEAYRMRRKDGSEIWVEDHGHYIRDKLGNITYHEGIIRDITERKQLEDEIRDQARFPSENPNPILRLDKRGIVLSANKASDQLLHEWDSGIGKAAPKLWCDLATAALSTGADRSIDIEFGGKSYTFLVKPIMETGYVNLYASDITERKRTDEALRESEAKYRTIFHESPLGIFRSTFEGRLLEVNPALAKMFGYDSPETMTREIHDVAKQMYVRSEDRQRIIANQWGSNDITQHVNHYRRRDGSQFIANLYLKTVRDTEGQPIFLEGMVQDITERKRLEGELKRYSTHLEELVKERSGKLAASEEKYRSVTENIPVAVWTSDQEGNTVFITSNSQRVYGYSPEQLYGDQYKYWWNRIHPEDVERVKSAYNALFRDGRAFNVEYRFQHLDGRWLWLHDSADKIYEKNGVKYTDGITSDITERKRMEDALRNREEMLREQEAFLEAIVENIPNMIFLKDAKELRFVRLNKTAEDLTGYRREHMIGKSDYDFFPVEQADYFVQKDRQVLEGRMLVDIPEEPILTNEKGQRILHTKKIPILDESGRPQYLLGISEDITERKRAEQALRKSEARYRRFFESSPISLWEEDFSEVKKHFDELHGRGVKDLRTYFIEHPEDLDKCARMVKILNVNEATLNLYGAKTVEELRGELRRVFTKEFQDNFREELVALGGGKTRFGSEFDNLTLTGDTKHVSLILSVIPGYEDTLAKVLVSIIDLTPQKQMEQELISAKERLEYLVKSNPAIIYIAKPLPDLSDYATTYQSKSTLSITGFEPEEFMGEKGSALWASRVHPDDLASYRAGTAQFWKERHRVCEYRFLHKNGTYRWIREEANVICDSRGNVQDVMGYWTDVTDLKRMEEHLLRSQRLAAIGETASMVAHDIRNPLQGITGAVHLLKQESLTAKEREEMLQVIEKSVAYSDAIVKDLSDYSAEIQLKLVEATPKSITRDTIEAVKVPENITVQDLSEEQPTLRVDRDRLRRVFVNLIENAIDAMPEGGTLAISSKQSDGSVEVTLSDTGLGMAERIMQNLWKPLQTTKAKGLGLGLPICKRIVEAHGGTISVKSKAGEGTTVTIHLPIKADASEVTQK